MSFIDFLIKAKVTTYASKGEGGETRLEDGRKELIFEEGDFKYVDRYEGSKSFSGKEIVLKDGQEIWLFGGHERNGERSFAPPSDE